MSVAISSSSGAYLLLMVISASEGAEERHGGWRCGVGMGLGALDMSREGASWVGFEVVFAGCGDFLAELNYSVAWIKTGRKLVGVQERRSCMLPVFRFVENKGFASSDRGFSFML